MEKSLTLGSTNFSPPQVPYLVGEIFVLEAPDVVQTMLEKRKYAITIAPDATLSLLAQIYSLIVDKK